MPPKSAILVIAGLIAAAGAPAEAEVVHKGLVLRGTTGVPPVGAPDTAAGRDCSNFSREEVDQTGHMTGASVQCGAGKTLAQLKQNLPPGFNAYCAVDVSRLGAARLITAPIQGNPEHCDLSAMKPKDAQSRFGGAKWR